MHPVEVILSPLGRALRNRRPGPAHSVANAPELATPNRFELSSSAFRDGEVIPAKHCSFLIGQDVSPALSWSALPTGTTDLLLVFEDLDAPGVVPRIHTVVAFAPAPTGIAEGALAKGAAGFRFQPRFGRPGGYAGPRPLPGHGPHHYRFHLYALDAAVDLTKIERGEQLPAAIAGHVLASAMLTGTRTS